MTSRVAQLPFLGCYRTLIIVCGFYGAVKYFLRHAESKEKTRHLAGFSYCVLFYIRFFYTGAPVTGSLKIAPV